MAQRPKKKFNSSNGVLHLTESVEFDEDGGIFYCTCRSAGAETVMSQTPHEFLVALERATACYNKWAATHREAESIKSAPVRIRLHREDG